MKFAERTASGWTTPRTVASGTNWFVNWADVPSVLRLDDGTLAAHWLQKSGPGTYAYDVKLSSSKDDGKTWSAPFQPHSDGTKTEHGFASLVQMPGSGLGLVWLDGRAMGEGEHADHSGDMSVRFAAFDKNWKQTAEMVIDGRVCECCPTAMAVTSEGAIAAFRNRSDTEVRDIHVAIDQRQVDDADTCARGQLANQCLPGQWPVAQCGGTRRRARMVHDQTEPRSGLCRIFE